MEEDPDVSPNDSDAEFEAMLEEAAVQSEKGSNDSNDAATPAPATTPKGGAKSKKGGAGAKGGKSGARGGGSSKGGKPKKGADDAEGYETDHQDYCEVC